MTNIELEQARLLLELKELHLKMLKILIHTKQAAEVGKHDK